MSFAAGISLNELDLTCNLFGLIYWSPICAIKPVRALVWSHPEITVIKSFELF